MFVKLLSIFIDFLLWLLQQSAIFSFFVVLTTKNASTAFFA